ncbi:MAG: hypothetical protein WA364_30605 [Candidatus Nitrosopolaris sp.]
MKRKIQGIPAIFEKDRSGLLYQDIMKYSINGKYKEDDLKSFRLWNLTKWLLEVNKEFRDHFSYAPEWNYTTANRIDDRIPRVRGKVEDLVNLGLIVQIGTAKQSKGTGTVPIFEFTHVGHAIAWIIESKGENS